VPTPKGPLTVVENFDLKINKGEFISLIGHSGCGKSTVLTMAAGLNAISKGSIVLDGTHVEGADPERAVVFQSPNLFPWLTAKENVAIGVDKVYPKASQAERQDVVEYYLERVGLADSMDKGAASLSNGMKQRVGIARAFALSPKLLLLDEPFGMLDSLTRWELQEVLMEVWSRTKVTAICVTHDVTMPTGRTCSTSLKRMSTAQNRNPKLSRRSEWYDTEPHRHWCWHGHRARH